jgi:iron only hydrogenase large subunit-like protein
MSTIFTSKAECRDCYKCIRYCPVKAIGLKDGQAWVVEEKCILCGQCIAVCPQQAKSTASQVPLVEKFLDDGERIIVSMAPSYLATSFFSTPWKIVAALKKAGVFRVEETILGAKPVAIEYGKLMQEKKGQTVITSCCPVTVNIIEKYYPSLLPSLSGLISPMVAHGRQIKAQWGEDAKVVFVGPCFAKKAERELEHARPVIDAVLTFEELISFFEQKDIEPEQLKDQFSDKYVSEIRTFPLKQGILKAAGISDTLSPDIISISGVDECMETFEALSKGQIKPKFIEALACRGGCINGPAMDSNLMLPVRKARLYHFSNTAESKGEEESREIEINLKRKHIRSEFKEERPTEEEIRKVLALTGKFTPEDETNCGGCGYSSCREKAEAVCLGLAELEMCIPYMKNKAQSFSNAVVESTDNGIIVVDKDLIIQEFNPAADQMFNLEERMAKGSKLEKFINAANFRKVWRTQKACTCQKSYKELDLITRQTIYPLAKYGVVIGIFTDVTAEEKRKSKFDSMRQEALTRASRVIREQMRIAQEIAGLLGESTSETKATLLELIEIMQEQEGNGYDTQN